MEEDKEEIELEQIPGNIPLIINSYIDIFSSFDSRPFTEKALSIDFLEECKRAVRDKGENVLELIISVPKDKRILSDETKIKKRLRDHFHKHFLEKEKDMKKIRAEGKLWVLLGIIINLVVVSGLINLESSLLHAILGLFEVPSWFLIWEGLGKIFIESRTFEFDYEFYRKMQNCKITFKGF